MSSARSTLAVVAATAVSIVSFASLALPSGAQTVAAPDGVGIEGRISQRQLRNGDAFEAISNGMSAADVLAKLGAPRLKVRFEATKTTAWDYHAPDPWGYDADFSVIINDAGVVVGKTRVRDSG